MKKILISLLLAVLILVPSCRQTIYVPYPMPDRTEEKDETEPDYSWLAAIAGTNTDPYILDTVGDIAGLSELVESGNDFTGKYFSLTENATYDFSELPNFQIGSGERSGSIPSSSISTDSKPFSGILDGKNATISGLTFIDTTGAGDSDNTTIGFIAMAVDATIKNLNFENCTVNANTSSAGIAVGFARNTSIENVVVSNSSISSAEGAAPIASRVYIYPNAVADVVVTGCKSIGNTVSSTGYNSGGLIGAVLNTSDKKLTFTNNLVDMSSAGSVTSGIENVGGMVGNATKKTGDVIEGNTVKLSSLNQISVTEAKEDGRKLMGILYGNGNFHPDTTANNTVVINGTGTAISGQTVSGNQYSGNNWIEGSTTKTDQEVQNTFPLS